MRLRLNEIALLQKIDWNQKGSSVDRLKGLRMIPFRKGKINILDLSAEEVHPYY